MPACAVDAKRRGVESLCGKPATHFVTFFDNGNGAENCCDAHIARAIREVLNTAGCGPNTTVQVTPLIKRKK